MTLGEPKLGRSHYNAKCDGLGLERRRDHDNGLRQPIPAPNINGDRRSKARRGEIYQPFYCAAL